ncbi:MAG TPA: hypothetical protein IAA29_14220 [Candidatus Paenibacillus intestinavium]|nr:hypothetical protein [Candidatus Paenibacillus intestinavium]
MRTDIHNKWEIGSKGLKTKWSDQVTPDHVLPHYPRPQLERSIWYNLNGLWDYCITNKDEQLQEKSFQSEGEILVPFPIESALSGVQRSVNEQQRLWYKRSFELPIDWNQEHTILHFGAVDWQTSVWINGQFVGEHTGGYCAFNFDISQYIVQGGHNEVLVAVWDPTDQGYQERGKQSLEPKGLFYTAVTGIWQTVWLENIAANSIVKLVCTPNVDEQLMSLHIHSMKEWQRHTLKITVSFKDQVVIKQNVQCKFNSNQCDVNIRLEQMELWSPDQPNLYDLKIEVWDLDQCIDQVSSYFAMRKCSIERDRNGQKRLCLNNQPIFQHGVLDQGYWPDGLYTAPTDEALIYDIKTMKQLGFNMLRKHIKVEPARWYYHCDQLGMLVWQDMINGGSKWDMWNQAVLPTIITSKWFRRDNIESSYRRNGRNDASNRAQFMNELKEMIDQLYHFPSIVLWCPFNESWGQFDAASIADWVQNYDSTRWVDHASGWHDQHYGEIKSVHTYFKKLSMPYNKRDQAVVISEYGGYNHLVRQHSENIVKETGYKRCKTSEELHHAYEQLILKQLLPLVKQGISAAVYTQVSDVEGEVNGLITYDRKFVKFEEQELQGIHQHLYAIEI